MKHLLITSLLTMFMAGTISAENWSSYSTANSGLPNNIVRTVCIDSFGVQWFGTEDGLARFDGISWTTYTTQDSLAHNSVNDIEYELAHGPEIWVATDNGVSVISVTPDAITFATPYRTSNRDLVSDQVNTVTVDDFHNKWFGTASGISRFDGTDWFTYLSGDIPNIKSDTVTCSAKSDSSLTLLGTNGGGVTRLDAETAATPYTAIDTGEDTYSNNILSVFTASDGSEWVGTESGLFHHEELEDDGGMWPNAGWTAYTTADGLVSNLVSAIAEDASGSMWFGTDSGLTKFDGEVWTTYTAANGLAGNMINDITIGDDGTIWIATDTGVSYSDDDIAVEEAESLPVELVITGAFPNPFNPTTTIMFEVPAEGNVTLDIYNLSGQRVRQLMNTAVSAGSHSVSWNGCDDQGNMLGSGLYFSRLRMGENIATGRMIFTK